jgi:hypothetical protein
VIFLGLDGVDWKLLDRLIADGTMPRLGALVRASDRRVLLTQRPALSPLVWTTMMTGVSPLEHRILDFTRFHPVTHEREPITSDERAVPAIWNMASHFGRKTGVFGVLATHPAENIHGVIVTDRDVAGKVNDQTENVRRRSLEWIRREKPDLAIVYYQGTDEVGHIVNGDIERARVYFGNIDTIIGELHDVALATSAHLVIASDHGFDWGGKHERTTGIATAEEWHTDEGILLWFSGRGETSGKTARVDQIAATLLALVDLPHDERLAEPIEGVTRSARAAVNYRRFFRRAAPAPSTPQPEALAKLKSLGYLGAGEPASSDSTRTPASFNNEGEILLQRGRREEAKAAFEAALALKPNYGDAKKNLEKLHR